MKRISSLEVVLWLHQSSFVQLLVAELQVGWIVLVWQVWGGGWGWWFECTAGQNGALSQKLLVTLLNSICHKGLFLLRTGAVFMRSFCLQKYGSDPILASHVHSFVSRCKKASKKKWWLLHVCGLFSTTLVFWQQLGDKDWKSRQPVFLPRILCFISPAMEIILMSDDFILNCSETLNWWFRSTHCLRCGSDSGVLLCAQERWIVTWLRLNEEVTLYEMESLFRPSQSSRSCSSFPRVLVLEISSLLSTSVDAPASA